MELARHNMQSHTMRGFAALVGISVFIIVSTGTPLRYRLYLIIEMIGVLVSALTMKYISPHQRLVNKTRTEHNMSSIAGQSATEDPFMYMQHIYLVFVVLLVLTNAMLLVLSNAATIYRWIAFDSFSVIVFSLAETWHKMYIFECSSNSDDHDDHDE